MCKLKKYIKPQWDSSSTIFAAHEPHGQIFETTFQKHHFRAHFPSVGD